MASDILHIKDSFYFEVPKALWRSDRDTAEQLAKSYGPWVIRNDEDYQDWEAAQMIEDLKSIVKDPKVLDGIEAKWKAWQHAKPIRHNRPFDQFLADEMTNLEATAQKWATKNAAPGTTDVVQAYLTENPGYEYEWMYKIVSDRTENKAWRQLRGKFDKKNVLDEYLESPRADWSEAKMAAYNKSLSGKIFIPQPFATLRNAYEVQSGFGVTRYMLIEVAVALICVVLFKWLAGRIATGQAPKGKLWNLLESFVTFVRNGVVVPAMGEHDADKYMPFFWTLFMFVLGCNLMGMIPFVGAPTSVFATTGAIALMIFGIGLTLGIRHFGVMGYLKNLAPSLGLPAYLAVFIVPLVWLIEALSLLIKHLILGVRLLANMVAGHLVLLGFMGIGFGVHAVSMSTGTWSLAAVIAIFASTMLSFLELFVAFLQAYILTFLAAMFIGSATHHH
ncbi:MAG: F0F1 ATP synthase subunit A [Pirellulaceae bacterium]|nr:F0F1 ATP synthase subunit A [Pirellulaceae bacterium]